MNRAEILALAERVEGLEGPNSEVDARIWCALNGKVYLSCIIAYRSRDIQVEYKEPGGRKSYVTGGGDSHAKPCTSSIDAAMSLIPSELYWEVAKGLRRNGKGPFWACCYTEAGDGESEPHSGINPAIALTAAALRAIASTIE